MNLETTQVAIIGAGPSGALAAAMLNKKGINVIVLEKSTFPRFCIGESLLPACMASIEAAGMLEAVNNAGFQLKRGAAFSRSGVYTSFDFSDKFTPGMGSTFQVVRGEFDKVLADEATRQGVCIRYQNTVESVDLSGEKSLLVINDEEGKPYQLEVDFILDASGYGRVLPRLLDLETPSCLPPRQAIFTHLIDNIDDSEFERDKILISVHPKNHSVWYWLIPFSNGTCSFGIVSEPAFFETYPDDPIETIRQLAAEEPRLAVLLAHAEYPNAPGKIDGYSANVSQLGCDKFALLGNAGEFLDPVFSSGVTIAMKSAELAVDALARQFSGEKVDWVNDYEKPLMRGVDTFRCYVHAWYDGSLQDVIFYPNPEPKIKRMVCSILAGYAWDTNNPFVKDPVKRLQTLAALCKED